MDHVNGTEGPYDVFCPLIFLEHQHNDLGVMLDCISNNLTEDGMGLITVPRVLSISWIMTVIMN